MSQWFLKPAPITQIRKSFIRKAFTNNERSDSCCYSTAASLKEDSTNLAEKSGTFNDINKQKYIHFPINKKIKMMEMKSTTLEFNKKQSQEERQISIINICVISAMFGINIIYWMFARDGTRDKDKENPYLIMLRVEERGLKGKIEYKGTLEADRAWCKKRLIEVTESINKEEESIKKERRIRKIKDAAKL